MSRRYEISDGHWLRVSPLLPGKACDPGRTAADSRLFVNAVLRVLRSGAPWADLPGRHGPHSRFTNAAAAGAARGVWERVFQALSPDSGSECLMPDSTVVRAHSQAAAHKKNSRGLAGRPGG